MSKLIKDESANSGAVMMLVAMAVGILVLITVVTLIPAVSYNVQTSVVIPSDSTDASQSWTNNGTHNTGVTNGSEMWAQLSPMISTTALVAIVGVLIAVLLGALAIRSRQ